jgi:hypothetical protein
VSRKWINVAKAAAFGLKGLVSGVVRGDRVRADGDFAALIRADVIHGQRPALGIDAVDHEWRAVHGRAAEQVAAVVLGVADVEHPLDQAVHFRRQHARLGRVHALQGDAAGLGQQAVGIEQLRHAAIERRAGRVHAAQADLKAAVLRRAEGDLFERGRIVAGPLHAQPAGRLLLQFRQPRIVQPQLRQRLSQISLGCDAKIHGHFLPVGRPFRAIVRIPHPLFVSPEGPTYEAK